MKNMEERKPVKGDAYDYYISAEEDRDLFEKIFLVDEIIDEIKKPIILFIDGIDARPREIDNEQYFPYRVEKRRPKMFWSYKERNYANIQLEVRRGGEYSFHMAYAKAFRII